MRAPTIFLYDVGGLRSNRVPVAIETCRRDLVVKVSTFVDDWKGQNPGTESSCGRDSVASETVETHWSCGRRGTARVGC
jgi:hypothetical protein